MDMDMDRKWTWCCATTTIGPEADRGFVRGACLLGFVLFINLKFLVVDVDVVALADHAVSRGPAFRCLWRVAFQPILICTLVAAAAGLDGLLTAEPPDSVTGGFYGRVGSGRSGSGGTTSATEEEIKNASSLSAARARRTMSSSSLGRKEAALPHERELWRLSDILGEERALNW